MDRRWRPTSAGSARRAATRPTARCRRRRSSARCSRAATASCTRSRHCPSASPPCISAPGGGRRTIPSTMRSASCAGRSAETPSRRARCSPRSTPATRCLPSRRQPPCTTRTSWAARRRGPCRSCSKRSVPELPEVETERGRLAAAAVGKRIASARIDDARLTRPEDPTLVAGVLEGDRIAAVDRRGKYIVVRLDSGNDLLVHLRMTGGFRYEPASHERAVLELDDGTRIAYRDLRRFGTWLLLDRDEAEEHLARRLGPEPLGRGFTTAFLARRLAGRKAPLKAAILDQRTVAGLGNIYADEALWHARLHPLRPAGGLAPDEIAALRVGIRRALRLGIARQGADLGDDAYAGGRMQDEFRAYGRAGEPCRRCGTPITKTRVAGRGTWFCPTCQAARRSSSRRSST